MELTTKNARLAVAAAAVACVLGAGMLACNASTQTGGHATTTEESSPQTEQEPQATVEEPAAEQEAPQGNTRDVVPTGNPELAQQLNTDIAAVADSAGMNMGVAVIDLTDGTQAGYQADQSMVSASMIKLIVAHTFLEHVEAGKFSLDDLYTLKATDLVGGAGVIAGYGAGAQVSYRDVLMRMIDESDNTAANILIDAVGMDAINADATRLGLAGTKINRRMMDYDAIAAGIENYVSADDIATLLRMVHENTFVSPDASALVLKALEQQTDWGGIRSGLPDGTVFAHKTGSLSNARHDGGIAEGDHPVVIVVLCGNGPSFAEPAAEQAMAQVASAVSKDCGL